jgi:hypothetical protein
VAEIQRPSTAACRRAGDLGTDLLSRTWRADHDQHAGYDPHQRRRHVRSNTDLARKVGAQMEQLARGVVCDEAGFQLRPGGVIDEAALMLGWG